MILSKVHLVTGKTMIVRDNNDYRGITRLLASNGYHAAEQADLQQNDKFTPVALLSSAVLFVEPAR